MEEFSKVYLAIRESKIAYKKAMESIAKVEKIVNEGLTHPNGSPVSNITSYDKEKYCNYIKELRIATFKLEEATSGLKGRYAFGGSTLVARVADFWAHFFVEFGQQEDGTVLVDSRTKDIVTFVIERNIKTALVPMKHYVEKGLEDLKSQKESWLRAPFSTASD